MPFALLFLLSLAFLWSESDDKAVTMRATGGMALALAALTRPEGLLLAGVAVLIRLWQDRRLGRRAAINMLGATLLPFGMIVIGYEVWRTSFYGYPFPNTFYAKTGTTLALLGRGLDYTWRFAWDHWLISGTLVAGFAMYSATSVIRRMVKNSRGHTEGESLQLVLVAVVVIYTLYVIVVGGDWFPAGRFFVPILAPIILLATRATQNGLKYLSGRATFQRAGMTALTVLVLAYAASSLWALRPEGGLWKNTCARLYRRRAAAGQGCG